MPDSLLHLPFVDTDSQVEGSAFQKHKVMVRFGLLAEAAASDTAGLTLRGFTYQALGQLAKRAPELFQKDTDIAAQFFSALSVEPPGVRAALQEAVSTLATAYKGCSGTTALFIMHHGTSPPLVCQIQHLGHCFTEAAQV